MEEVCDGVSKIDIPWSIKYVTTMSNIQAVKNSVPIALAGMLPDGRFQQVLPEEFFFQSEEEWRKSTLKRNGNDVVFEQTDLSHKSLKERNITWTCFYCRNGRGFNHIPCMKTAGHPATFQYKRIWSDPSVQVLYKNKS